MQAMRPFPRAIGGPLTCVTRDSPETLKFGAPPPRFLWSAWRQKYVHWAARCLFRFNSFSGNRAPVCYFPTTTSGGGVLTGWHSGYVLRSICDPSCCGGGMRATARIHRLTLR